MAVIDSNNFIAHLVWSGLVDKATCGELKEAIELCTVKDIYTKADMVAMLTDIQLEIEESESCGKAFHLGLHMASDIITKKINALKSCNDCISNNGNTCNVCHDKDMYKEK